MGSQHDELFSGDPALSTGPTVEPRGPTETTSREPRVAHRPSKPKARTRKSRRRPTDSETFPAQGANSSNAPTDRAKRNDGRKPKVLGEPLDQVVPLVFQHIEHAEELNAAFTRKYPEHARRFMSGFKYLGWFLEVPVADMRLYRAHVTELLQRVVDGERWMSATGAEVLTWLLKTGVETKLSDAELAVAVWLCDLFYGVSVPAMLRQYVPEVDDATLRDTTLRLKAQLARSQRDIPL